MDIERLKELKAEFGQVRKYNDRHCMSTVTEDDVLEVLDEAIARQTTSEDVAEAIEHFKSLQKRYITQHDGVNCKRVETAITALQAYEPTTRKNRTVEEVDIPKTETTSCEWCEDVTKQYFDVNWYKYEDNMLFGVEHETNYCPNCGRKLN